MSTNTVLRELQPSTEYRVTLVPVYLDVEGKQVSENGKTSEYTGSQTITPSVSPFVQHNRINFKATVRVPTTGQLESASGQETLA